MGPLNSVTFGSLGMFPPMSKRKVQRPASSGASCARAGIASSAVKQQTVSRIVRIQYLSLPRRDVPFLTEMDAQSRICNQSFWIEYNDDAASSPYRTPASPRRGQRHSMPMEIYLGSK